MKGGGRQRRAGVSGRGLEFHLNDCPSAHAAPRSRPARALQPAAGRPAGGRPRHGPGAAGAPRSPAPDRGSFGGAELASRAPLGPRPGARQGRRGSEQPGGSHGRRDRHPRNSAAPPLGAPRGALRCQPRGRAQAAGRPCPSRTDREAACYMEFGPRLSPPGLVARPRPWRSPPPPARHSPGGGDAAGGARGARTQAPSSGGRARGRRW